jgi:hypothetical protein
MSLRCVPQAASCAGDLLKRQVLVVLAGGLLSLGGIGLIFGLIWLIESRVQRTVPYLLESRFETLRYVLPMLLLAVTAAGVAFMLSVLTFSQRTRTAISMGRFKRIHTPNLTSWDAGGGQMRGAVDLVAALGLHSEKW